MHNDHVVLSRVKHLAAKNKAVLQSDVVLFVEESFSLDSCHVQYVEFRNGFFKAAHLFPFYSGCIEHFLDIARQIKFNRRNHDKADILISYHCLNEGMNGTAEFEVSAKAYCQPAQTALLPMDGQKVCKCLCRMEMTSVTSIDDRHGRASRSHKRRAFFRMSHRYDICIAAYHCDGIRYALAF